MMSSHSDQEARANRISEAMVSIQKSIELLKSSGDIAPTGCSIVHYQARGSKKHYWYYKLQASEPIFPTKTGKMTRYKHLGASGTEAHIEALMQINRRNQLEAKIDNPGLDLCSAGLIYTKTLSRRISPSG